MPGSQGTIKGKKKGEVHEVFVNRLKDLRRQAAILQNSIQGKHQREWQVPTDFTKSLLDVPNLHNPAFDREPINTQYQDVTNNPEDAGTGGDVVALKLQLDYNAAEERAFRARHMTPVRAFCIGHGRRFGHGHGNVFDRQRGIEALIASWLAAGGASSE